MRVALVFPNSWPYARRGVERMIAEYAAYLVGAGHCVDIITSKPGQAHVVQRGHLTTYYERRLDHPVLARRWPWLRYYSFTLVALRRLVQHPYDVTHIWLYTYGLAARVARLLRGGPYLYQVMMGNLLIRPGALHERLVREVVLPANRVATLTTQAAVSVGAALHRSIDVLPPCVDTETFMPAAAPNPGRPEVLFASNITAEPKGGRLLLASWDEIHRHCPQARLVLAGALGTSRAGAPAGAHLVRELVHSAAARDAVDLVGEGRLEDLPARYARAAVTVLPSLGEAFGLVLAESLACGTPVVGNACGGAAAIITDPRVGTTVSLPDTRSLYDADQASRLAGAVLSTIDLSQAPATRQWCRRHAQQWSRANVGRQLEHLYSTMLHQPRPVMHAGSQ